MLHQNEVGFQIHQRLGLLALNLVLDPDPDFNPRELEGCRRSVSVKLH